MGGAISDSTFRDVSSNGALSSSDDFIKQCFLVQPLEIKFVVGGAEGRQLFTKQKISFHLPI